MTTLKASLIAEANKCVLCGMCLPHCPTYSLAQNENESPRGRLVLGKALLSGDVEESEALIEHIDHCLVCRGCEKSCPSGVKFGAFMDGLRTHLSKPENPEHDFTDILVNQEKRRALNKKLWLGQRSGAFNIGKLFLGDAETRILNSLPKLERFQELADNYPANNSELAKIMLFTGCNSELLGNSLVFTALSVLNKLGVSVEVPKQQVCCGGLSRHHGDAQTADDLEVENLAAFSTDENIPIVTLASGCGASLLDYGGLESDAKTNAFSSRITDINQFIVEHIKANPASLKPLHKKVILHTPCSMKNVMRQDNAVQALLSMIPELKVKPITSQRGCCGAAGTYMYDHADNADALRDPIIDEIKNQQAEILITTNIGCAMHIQAGLKDAGVNIKLMHPVELLAEAIS